MKRKPKSKPDSAKRRGKRVSLDVHAKIDAFFTRTIIITVAGKRKRLTCFEAILQQLWHKALTSRKAHKLFNRYIRFAAASGPGEGVYFAIETAPGKYNIF